ncbi:MAG: argininosuccinate synthase [Planctomycetota bacterium]
MAEKVVLAYSGGLDTSVILKWLANKGYHVIACTVDVGQREDFSTLKRKAMGSGAKKLVIRDVKEAFLKEFAFPALQFNARYEGRYLLGTSLARPVIARELITVAREEKAGTIAHGATGKGNDQVRFELTAYALMPDVKVIAPWRDPEFNTVIKGRREAIEYAAKHRIPVKATVSKPWSSDENLMHISYESGILEDPARKPDKAMFELTVDPEDAPDRVTKLTVGFDRGVPVTLNGKAMRPVALVEKLNQLGGANGIGREDMVENRFVGMKSRGVYETPGFTILHKAHRDLEGLTLTRDEVALKESLMPRFAALAYNGFWYAREMELMMALLKESQRYVTGEVRLELYKGNVTVTGRTSPCTLYQPKVASMEDDRGAYNQADATGFIRLNALQLRAHARRVKK